MPRQPETPGPWTCKFRVSDQGQPPPPVTVVVSDAPELREALEGLIQQGEPSCYRGLGAYLKTQAELRKAQPLN